MHYHGEVHAAILVYDITIKLVDEVELHSCPEIVVIFLGNKPDLLIWPVSMRLSMGGALCMRRRTITVYGNACIDKL